MNELIIVVAKYLIYAVAVGAVLTLLFKKEHRIKFGVIAIIALPVGYALARIAGMFYAHSQPFAVLGFDPLIPHEVDNSFPSDHVLIAGIFSSVAYLAHRWVGIGLWVLTLFIGLARVAAGLHWGVDVLASCVLSVAVVWAVHYAVQLSGYFK